MFIVISVQGKRFSVVWSTLLTKKKNSNTQMPHSMKPPLPQSLPPCFSISLFFFFFLHGQTAGGLPTLECYRFWVVANEIVWPQHLRPLYPQCHKHLHPWWRKKKKKKHSVQRQLAAIKCKKIRQLQSQSRSADLGVWRATANATSATERTVLFVGNGIVEWVISKRNGGR